MNPDNLATPLAASIGDVVSISLFSFIVQLLYSNIGECFHIVQQSRMLTTTFLLQILTSG